MIIEDILNTENYVDVDPSTKDSCAYKMTYLIKEEVRKHKWNEGTAGRVLTWEEARDEWIAKYKNDYLKFVKCLFKPKKKKKKELLNTYSRREPVVTGGIL